MEIIKIDIKNINKDVFLKVNTTLKNGGIVVHPTDTCYGVAADIMNEIAVQKVYNFKKRSLKKPLNVIVENQEMFKKYGKWSDLIIGALKEERIHSFVVKKTGRVKNFFNNNREDIAIQIPRNFFSLTMLNKFASPLTATSANVSQKPPVYSIDKLLEQLENKKVLPDLIIDGGELPYNKPSRMVIVKNNNFEILRD